MPEKQCMNSAPHKAHGLAHRRRARRMGSRTHDDLPAANQHIRRIAEKSHPLHDPRRRVRPLFDAIVSSSNSTDSGRKNNSAAMPGLPLHAALGDERS